MSASLTEADYGCVPARVITLRINLCHEAVSHAFYP